jgi:hypothetical protein
MIENLYLVSSGNKVKLGYSSDIENRMKSYRTHNPDFELINVFYREDAKEFEKYLHKKYFNNRKLEWYDKDFLNTILKEVDSTPKIEKVDKEFFYMNEECIPILYGQNLSNSSPKIFWWLLEKYQGVYSNFAINKALKEEASEALKLTTRTIDTALKELSECGLISKTGRSTYKINALFVWKGELKDRPNHITLNLVTD